MKKDKIYYTLIGGVCVSVLFGVVSTTLGKQADIDPQIIQVVKIMGLGFILGGGLGVLFYNSFYD